MRIKRQNSVQRSRWTVGWVSRITSQLRSRQNFFLDIPFYRTHRQQKRRIKSAYFKKQATIRGLNQDYNHDLKGLFKGAATRASVQPGPFQEFYQRSLAKGIQPTLVRLTLARKIAALTLTLWKKGEDFDIHKLTSQAA